MTPPALAKAKAILGGASLEDVANWADDYRRDHPETGPWHYIDIPLADSKIDMARECPDGQCVIAQTEHFLTVLKDPKADRAAKAEALRFVVHFVGDLHQPLHDEDDRDKGGNERRVTFDRKPDNLHWVGTRDCRSTSTAAPRCLPLRWRVASHRRARHSGKRVASRIGSWRDTGWRSENPAVIGRRYEEQADAVTELQLEEAGVRLASLLDAALK
jgi:hypothetical protein